MRNPQKKLSEAASPSNKTQLTNLLFKQQKSPIPSPSVSPTQISLPKSLYPHKDSQFDLAKLATMMKQYNTRQNDHSKTPSMSELIMKARALTANQQVIHIRNDSQQTRKPSKETSLKDAIITKNSFAFDYVIGIGGFGKVWKVNLRKNNQSYAMKEMSKALVIAKKSVNSVLNERTLLSKLKHPFLINMYYAFQDRENLYLVMDYMKGGDLRYHIGRKRRFNEEQTKFFVASIYVALDYLHNNKIIHRDIKPENLVLDEQGYVHLTDLGIARIMRPENSADTSGTPGYMAPEVMCRQNHTFAVDYYALGVIAYEFMLGRRPYVGRSRQEIRDQILAKQVQIRQSEAPTGWSMEAIDCVNRLLQRKPASRLGFNGGHEMKLHPWFKNFPWSKLQSREMKAPYIPNQSDDNFDQRQIIIEDEENNELIQYNQHVLRENNCQQQFVGYEFGVQVSMEEEYQFQ